MRIKYAYRFLVYVRVTEKKKKVSAGVKINIPPPVHLQIVTLGEKQFAGSQCDK